jgi:hypothetical protein
VPADSLKALDLDRPIREADMPRPQERIDLTPIDLYVWSGRALQEDFFELADVRSCINVSGL